MAWTRRLSQARPQDSAHKSGRPFTAVLAAVLAAVLDAASPPLREIVLPPQVDPATFAETLLRSPEGADPTSAHGLFARACADVRVWIKREVGLTPNYALVETAAGTFALLPLGAGRCTARRDTFRKGTGGGTTYGHATLEHPALVFRAPGLPKPLWVVFDGSWDGDEHELDAAAAFVNRA